MFRHIRIASFALLSLIFLASAEGLASGKTLRVAFPGPPVQVISVPLEDYVMGVLTSEMPVSWPLEALKAQAIAARSYAIYRIQHPRHRHYDVEAGVADQAFRWADQYPERTRQAVRATSGQILNWRGEAIPAFFHSCCGGQTEQASHVWTWAQEYSFYEVRSDPFCHQCPTESWEFAVDKEELSQQLQSQAIASGTVDHVVPQNWSQGRRVKEVAVITDAETIALPSQDFRALLGYENVKSTSFSLLESGKQVTFVGQGFGHGVGLCQWGAREMARQGKSYREILQFYYPGVTLGKIR